jgi:cytochrome c-type biogenesis protein CcmH
MLLIALLVAMPLHAKDAEPLAEDPVMEQRLIALSEDLRCLVCQNESLAGSHAELAEDLRREIRAQMKAGKSDAEVIDYLTARYGDFVLYKPPVKRVTWLLWFGPFALLAGALGGMAWYLKRRAAQVGMDDEEPSPETSLRSAPPEGPSRSWDGPANDLREETPK